jgi:hypothetical protein
VQWLQRDLVSRGLLLGLDLQPTLDGDLRARRWGVHGV